MSIPLGADTVTRLREPARDWQGDPTGAAAELAITGCLVQPAGSSNNPGGSAESSADGDTVTALFEVHAPPGSDVLETDRVRLADGTEGAVDGKPGHWHDDLGLDSHVLFMVRVTEGQ